MLIVITTGSLYLLKTDTVGWYNRGLGLFSDPVYVNYETSYSKMMVWFPFQYLSFRLERGCAVSYVSTSFTLFFCRLSFLSVDNGDNNPPALALIGTHNGGNVFLKNQIVCPRLDSSHNITALNLKTINQLSAHRHA